ncbi:hypothetical protein PybrP1_006236 [[Pythium] brassicae (nom. inval.)]|nr:hypothetical protein PybrP1_006236 [[Pythium] brassicae (nom. inval.)]
MKLLLATTTLLAASSLSGLPSVSAASFVVTESGAAPASSAAVADLKFLKQISVSGDAGGELAAISALVLDLPGQVFVSYAPSTAASGSLLGDIKVYADTELLATSVSVVSARAMRGSKLVVSSSVANSTSSRGGAGDLMLTEIVLRRKHALKKLITNGIGDVVVLNDVLFTKSRAEPMRYPVVAHTLGAPPPALVALPDRANRSTWVLADPGNGSASFSLALDGGGVAILTRVDTDLLPEGAIGTAFAYAGEALVRSSSTAETLFVRTADPSMTVRVNLAPSVEVIGIAQNLTAKSQVTVSNTLYRTVSDDALTVLVNGSGNLIVSARNSTVFADSADFQAFGAGFLQAWFQEVDAAVGIQVVNRDQQALTTRHGERAIGLVATPSILCIGSTTGSNVGVMSRDVDRNTTTCRTYDEPLRTGRAGSLVEMMVPSTGAPSSTARVPIGSFVSTLAAMAAVIGARIM